MSSCATSADCSAYASCSLSVQRCVCDDLWSMNADFILNDECSLSFLGMYVLWGVNLCLIIWVVYKSAAIVIARIENFQSQRRAKKGYTLLSNKALLALLIYTLVSLPFHIIMCVLHLADPGARVGFDTLPTLCFFFGKLGLYGASMFIQGPFLSSALKSSQSPEHKSLVRKNYAANISISMASIFLGALPFIILGSFETDRASQVAILQFYYFVQAGVLGLNALNAFIVQYMVNKSLDAAVKILANAESTMRIKAKINAFQSRIVKQGALQCAVYVLMGAIPFFLNKHNYFLPMSWIVMPLLGKDLAFQINLDKAGTRSLMERFGLKRTGGDTGTGSGGTGDRLVSPYSGKRAGSFAEGNPLSNVVTSVAQSSVVVVHSEVDGARRTPLAKHAKHARAKAARAQSSVQSSETGRLFQDLIAKESDHRKNFSAFVRSRYATEELELYDGASEFHALAKDPKTAQAKLDRLGKAICKKHLVENAPLAVDLPDTVRKAVLEFNASGHFPRTAFDSIRTVTFNELKDNFHHAFAKREGLEGVAE